MKFEFDSLIIDSIGQNVRSMRWRRDSLCTYYWIQRDNLDTEGTTNREDDEQSLDKERVADVDNHKVNR